MDSGCSAPLNCKGNVNMSYIPRCLPSYSTGYVAFRKSIIMVDLSRSSQEEKAGC